MNECICRKSDFRARHHMMTEGMKTLCSLLTLSLLTGCVSESDIREGGRKMGKVVDEFRGEPVVPRSANRLFIQPLSDMTGSGLSERLFLKIRDEIGMDGRLGISDDSAVSDLRLDVAVAGFEIQNIEYDPMGFPVRKRMRITCNMRVFDLKKDRVILHESGLQAFRVFSDIKPPIEMQPQALESVLADLAKRIAAKTITGWYTGQMTIIERNKK